MKHPILDLLYPPKCVFCERLLSRTERYLCTNCLYELPECENGKHVDSAGVCTAPFYYEAKAAEAILRFKFRGETSYAEAFGFFLAQRLGAPDAELVTWIPVSRLRKLSRTYDQAELLARQTAKRLGLPCVRTLRKRHTVRQSRLHGAAERRANVAGAFSVPDPAAVNGKRILLIDDICTTGSTLSEAVRVLKNAGAAEISCAALAVTKEHQNSR